MKIVFEPGDEITLRRIDECDDLENWGLTQDEYDILLGCQEVGTIFDVVCEDTDDYYTIKSTCDGTVFEAISVYHLRMLNTSLVELDL
jgi:hypothetical protein